MAAAPQILVYSPPDTSDLIDYSFLMAGGYDITNVSHIQAIESWLITFLEDALLIIAHPSPTEGLRYSAEILKTFPHLPIILIARECDESLLRQALSFSLIDFLTTPVDPSTLLHSIRRGLDRQKYWQEWNRFNHVLNGLNDGIILADLEGCLLVVNASAKDIFLLEAEQLEGKTVSEVFNHSDLLDLFTSRGPFPHRSEISLENGRIYSAQASLISNIGIAAVFQEITHLKELDRIKTEFVNTVSHDLRSPLTAIYGFVGLIDRVGPINLQQAEFIRHIQSSVQHITALINDLLELGRVEADHDIQMEEINLKEIVLQSINNLDYQLNEKMQELTLKLPDDVPPILGNRIHLQRMIINLIENAIKFTPPLGKINVRCRAEASQLILEVADNGHGIPLVDQPYIFDKFFRASNVSEDTPGTGLGLSIVKTIIEKHHGRIWVESLPVGTMFTVILPIK
jgi:two-component system phosphate regulon sensor histidine kinase PhoR